jgi:hypothetical protein
MEARSNGGKPGLRLPKAYRVINGYSGNSLLVEVTNWSGEDAVLDPPKGIHDPIGTDVCVK